MPNFPDNIWQPQSIPASKDLIDSTGSNRENKNINAKGAFDDIEQFDHMQPHLKDPMLGPDIPDFPTILDEEDEVEDEIEHEREIWGENENLKPLKYEEPEEIDWTNEESIKTPDIKSWEKDDESIRSIKKETRKTGRIPVSYTHLRAHET